MADALQGVRVIDFSQYIAGPMAGMLLADFGADVIRVDPPMGPRYDTPANATWNRGKRSIALDLKNESDLQTARKLIAGADVVIENSRPGVMTRLGLGPKAMTALNSRLIYCSIPGFSSDDPRAGVKAWEGIVGGASGVFRPHIAAKNDRPIYTVLPISSVFGAQLSAVSIAMALIERDDSGRGQIIEAPLFNASFTAFSCRLMKTDSNPGEALERRTNWRHALCKDGRWFTYIPGKLESSIIAESGMAKLLDASANQEKIAECLAVAFKSRTANQWEDYFAENGAEGITCHTSAEWLRHPLAVETESIAGFNDPVLGRFQGPGIAPRLSETPGRVRTSRPLLDAHRVEILEELSNPKRISSESKPIRQTIRSALHGVKVLDLGIILSIPSCGRTLAEFGANVIKIDPPQRNPVNYHNDINRGKRSILLDLKTDEGQKIFWRLVEDADVVLENFRVGVADRLGIGYEAVRARRPGIVYCSVSAFGQSGSYSRRPGRDPIAQAVSGMQVRYGSETPELNPFIACDYTTGLLSCYGVCLALLHSKRTGKGQHVQNALIYAATMLQSNLLQDYEGKRWDGPHGQEALGEGPLYRAYETRDAWIFLAAQSGDLSRCPELADLANLVGTSLELALENRFCLAATAEWVAKLTKADIGAHRIVRDLASIVRDPVMHAQGLLISRHHDELGVVTTTGPAVKLSRTPPQPGRPAPKPGSDAAEILEEIGMRGDLDRLILSRVIVVEGIHPGGQS